METGLLATKIDVYNDEAKLLDVHFTSEPDIDDKILHLTNLKNLDDIAVICKIRDLNPDVSINAQTPIIKMHHHVYNKFHMNGGYHEMTLVTDSMEASFIVEEDNDVYYGHIKGDILPLSLFEKCCNPSLNYEYELIDFVVPFEITRIIHNPFGESPVTKYDMHDRWAQNLIRRFDVNIHITARVHIPTIRKLFDKSSHVR